MPATICPAIGSGRGLTNYLTHCELESTLQKQFRVRDDGSYRDLLQRHPSMVDDGVKVLTPPSPYFPVNACADAASMQYKNVQKGVQPLWTAWTD
jgi:hypothetical protein